MTKLLSSGGRHDILDAILVCGFQPLEPTGERVVYVVVENFWGGT